MIDWLIVCFMVAGVAVIVVGGKRHRREVGAVLSSRGEEAGAPGIESIPEDPMAQTCAVYAAGLDEPTAACLRRNYVPMSDDERYELDLTFASIVAPEEVEP